MWTLFGSNGSGSAAVEMALMRCGVPFRIERASTWEADSAQAALRQANPLGQIPTVVTDDGEVLTESAAILIELGLRFPDSGLLPIEPVARAQAVRGLVFIAANCYAAIGVIDYPERITTATDAAELDRIRQGARRRLHDCWSRFAEQFQPQGDCFGGAAPGGLDLLTAVVSRWSGTRAHLKAKHPALLAQMLRVEAHPALAPVFARHWPAV